MTNLLMRFKASMIRVAILGPAIIWFADKVGHALGLGCLGG